MFLFLKLCFTKCWNNSSIGQQSLLNTIIYVKQMDARTLFFCGYMYQILFKKLIIFYVVLLCIQQNANWTIGCYYLTFTQISSSGWILNISFQRTILQFFPKTFQTMGQVLWMTLFWISTYSSQSRQPIGTIVTLSKFQIWHTSPTNGRYLFFFYFTG